MELDKTLFYGAENCKTCHYNYSRQLLSSDYLDDCTTIQELARGHGFDISLQDAHDLWEDYSDNWSAGWMMLDIFENVWEEIKIYFIDLDD